MTVTGKPFLGRRGTSAASWCLRVVSLGALVVAAVVPLHRLTVPGGSVPVTLAPDVDSTFDLPGLPGGTSVGPADGGAVLDVGSLPIDVRLFTVASTVLAALAVAAGAWWLAGVLRSVGAGRPFDPRNPRRLAGVAAALLLGGLAAPMTGNAASIVVLDHLGLTGPDSPFALVLLELDLAPVLLALVVLAAAEAFQRGAALTHEVDGLV
jgi:hypothetical protein